MSTYVQLNRRPGGTNDAAVSRRLRCARRFRAAILLAGAATVGLPTTMALAGPAVAATTAAARPDIPMGITTPFLNQPGFHAVAAQNGTHAWAVGDTTAGNAVFAYGTGISFAAKPHVPPFPPPVRSYLQGVAAIPPVGAKALTVGYTVSGGVARALIGRGNTLGWGTLYSGTPKTYLYGVATTSASNAWAVGFRLVGTKSFPLILHGTGASLTTWTSVPAPLFGLNTYLYGVAATSPNNVWAVGYVELNPAAPAKTLIYHYNGITWTRMPSPSPAPNSLLFGVAALISTRAYAVGGTTGGGHTSELILSLNSGTWHQVPAGDVHFLHPVLDSILYSVTFTKTAWAVGGAGVSPNHYETVILRHFPFSSSPVWNQQLSPNLGTQDFLFGVSAFTSVSAWAVGSHSTPPGPNHFLDEHWNGSSWI
jgi:hypothetical protein